MKFETITVMQRRNTGNYEHIEITTTARLDEGEDFISAAMTARTYVDAVLNMPLDAVQAKQEPVTYDEETKQNLPVSEVKAKKEKKQKKEKVEESVVEVVPEETPEEYAKKQPPKEEKKKPYVKYDSNVAEHKSIFGGYLNKKYGDAWKEAKPKEEIQSFTKALNGKEFLDDAGQIVESFLNEVHGFFGG